MKQSLFVCVCTLAAVVLIACGSGGSKKTNTEDAITIVGADGTEYSSYQDCCAAGDFVAAHRFVEKMEESGRYITDDARDYVFREEALFLMSKGTEDAQRRIIYLLKQDDSNSHDAHCDILVELAIDTDDEAFLKKLTKHYNEPIGSDILRKIVEYLYMEKGGDSNLEFVATLLNRYNQGEILMSAAAEKGDEALVAKLASQISGTISFSTYKDVLDYLRSHDSPHYSAISSLLKSKVKNKKELLDYAISTDDYQTIMEHAPEYGDINDYAFVTALIAAKKPEMSNAIIKMLTNYTIPGKVPSPYVDYKGNTPDYQAVRDYIDGIGTFNGLCAQVLDIAITHGNQQVAQRVLPLFKARPGFWDFPPGSLVDNVGTITIDDKTYDDAREAAQKRYNEALCSGAFK